MLDDASESIKIPSEAEDDEQIATVAKSQPRNDDVTQKIPIGSS